MLLHSGRLRRGEQLQLPRETENGLLGQRLNEREAGTGGPVGGGPPEPSLRCQVQSVRQGRRQGRKRARRGKRT